MSRLTLQDAIRLAMQLQQSRRLPEAESLYRQILQAHPQWGDGYSQLAGVLVEMNQVEPAIVAMQNAISTHASNPVFCYSNLGVLLHQAGRYEQALAAYENAIAIQPGYAIAHRNCGDTLRQIRQYERAEQSYRVAIALDPKMSDAYVGIGLCLYHRALFSEALDQFEIARRLNPADVNACMDAVLCHGRLGDGEKAEAALRTAIALSPNDPELTSGLVMFVNYAQGDHPPVVLNESLEYNRRHVVPVVKNTRHFEIKRSLDRPVRIGYVSPDFKEHSVAYFLEPVFAHHNHKSFKIICYAEVDAGDERTTIFKSHADAWRNTVNRSPDEIAEQVRADGVDILIDLAGHTLGNRLDVFARKPAPIQITWLGYPNTTGISTMDYRLTDRFADPLDADRFYTEKLIRLPHAFFVYQPPKVVPRISPPPVSKNGYITFGSFNNICKITPATGQLWAEILQAVTHSRLLVAGIPPAAESRLRRLMPHIDHSRIEFVQSIDLGLYFELFSRVDIALDAFPWAGHTTTCHALWMGVPVISLAGQTAVSRAGASILTNLELQDEWLANSREEYVAKAIARATHSDQLKTLRSALRDRMRLSPLTQAARFTADLEQTLAEIYQK